MYEEAATWLKPGFTCFSLQIVDFSVLSVSYSPNSCDWSLQRPKWLVCKSKPSLSTCMMKVPLPGRVTWIEEWPWQIRLSATLNPNLFQQYENLVVGKSHYLYHSSFPVDYKYISLNPSSAGPVCMYIYIYSKLWMVLGHQQVQLLNE